MMQFENMRQQEGIDMIFVFGSNLAGRHGAGAAKYAAKFYGAEYGVGYGRTGNSYAIPTKDEKLNTLDYDLIEDYIWEFINYAMNNPSETFLLTPIGCGLAGLDPIRIKNLFVRNGIRHCKNVVLHTTWFDHL